MLCSPQRRCDRLLDELSKSFLGLIMSAGMSMKTPSMLMIIGEIHNMANQQVSGNKWAYANLLIVISISIHLNIGSLISLRESIFLNKNYNICKYICKISL